MVISYETEFHYLLSEQFINQVLKPHLGEGDSYICLFIDID